jgi:hypothetical protein
MNKRWGSEIVYNFVELIWLSTATQKDSIKGKYLTQMISWLVAGIV